MYYGPLLCARLTADERVAHPPLDNLRKQGGERAYVPRASSRPPRRPECIVYACELHCSAASTAIVRTRTGSMCAEEPRSMSAALARRGQWRMRGDKHGTCMLSVSQSVITELIPLSIRSLYTL